MMRVASDAACASANCTTSGLRDSPDDAWVTLSLDGFPSRQAVLFFSQKIQALLIVIKPANQKEMLHKKSEEERA